MPTLKLVAGSIEVPLDMQSRAGTGWEATSGVTGLGLPPVQAQWQDATGDGARYRGRRVLPRDIDLKLDAYGKDRQQLRELIDTMSLAVAEEARLVWIEDDGEEWHLDVVRTGGGGYVYGVDTNGDRELNDFIITVRAGDPFWTATEPDVVKVTGGGAKKKFLVKMVRLPVSSSQQIGEVNLENRGTAPAYPIWEARGPGHHFDVRLPNGRGFTWEGLLAAGDKLVIDTKTATVLKNGVNAYSQMAPSPKMWPIPPGKTIATASLIDTTSASSITCRWNRRRWAVI